MSSVIQAGVLAVVLVSPSVVWANQELNTKTGQQIGVTVSKYQYREPSVDVEDKGNKLGLDYTSSLELQDDYFVKMDGRFAYGDVDYTGSGTMNNQEDWYYDLRGLVGKDFSVAGSVLAPYTGFGARHLYNDARGQSSTGAWGYRRKSNYFYIPVGVTHRIELQSQSMLETTLEYDYLCTGKQVTRMGDVYEGENGVTETKQIENKQKNGYGLRASAMVSMNNWSFGPYITYWNIKTSEDGNFYVYRASEDQWYYSAGWYEPHNRTVEFGLKASYSF